MRKNALWMTMLLGSFAMSAPIEAGIFDKYTQGAMDGNYENGVRDGIAEGRKNVETEKQPQIDAIAAKLSAQTAKNAELLESAKKITQVILNLKVEIKKKITDIAKLSTEIETIKKEKEKKKKEQEEAAKAAKDNNTPTPPRRRY